MSLPLLPADQRRTESPPLARLSPDSFFRQLVKLNHLEGISHFLFLPGMLFNDAGQWWGKKKMRTHPHEGIDIYLMRNIDGGIENVLPQMQIPAILPGYPVHFHRDFLGETLYVRHPEISREGAVLHTIYGHGQFNTDQSSPSFINKGVILGTISHPPATSAVPAHLHISCAWIMKNQRIEELNWEDMATNSNVHFIDPLPYLLR